MDFTLGETQRAVAQAAAHVLDRSAPLPAPDDRAQRGEALWKELGSGGPARPGAARLAGRGRARVMDTAVLLTEVAWALARTYASLRINELLNWQVAAAPTVEIADASVTKCSRLRAAAARRQRPEEVVGRHRDPADEETAALYRRLDIQAKRNTVLTFGGGVNEIQRELIATAGPGLPGVPR